MARPVQYTDKILKEKLIDILKSTDEKITPTLLSQKTGIHRHVWTRRYKKLIDEVNKDREIFLEDDIINSIEIPSAVDIIEKNWDNKETLLREMRWFDFRFKEAYERVGIIQKLEKENKELKSKIEECNERLREILEEKENLRDLYLEAEARLNIYYGLEYHKNNNDILEFEKEKNKIKNQKLIEKFDDLF